VHQLRPDRLIANLERNWDREEQKDLKPAEDSDATDACA
jgi:hypothetical protein